MELQWGTLREQIHVLGKSEQRVQGTLQPRAGFKSAEEAALLVLKN